MTVEIVTYSSTASTLAYNRSNYKTVLRNISAGGRTNFVAAFSEVIQLLKHGTTRDRNVVIVFMTDGADTCSAYPMRDCTNFTEQLRLDLTEASDVVVHAIGFTSESHFQLLDKIRLAGKRPGVFRFAENEDGMEALKLKFQEVFDVVSDSIADVHFVIASPTVIPVSGTFPTRASVSPGGEVELNFWVRVAADFSASSLTPSPSQNAGEASHSPLPHSHVQPRTLSLTVYDKTYTVPLERHEPDVPAGMWAAWLLEMDVDELVSAMTDAAQQGKLCTSDWRSKLMSVQERLRAVVVFGERGLSKQRRHELLILRGDMQERLDRLHRLLATSVQGSARNEGTTLLARAADIAFSAQFSKARRQRLLDKLVVSNVSGTANIETKLRELHTAQLDQPRAALPAEARDFFFCTLSQCSVEDLMHDDFSEVLGFGLAVQRSEAVVDCPTLIRLCNISSTLCSRSSLEDAVRYSIAVEGHTRTHGGFDSEAELGVAVRGRSREPINAWLPLYINK